MSVQLALRRALGALVPTKRGRARASKVSARPARVILRYRLWLDSRRRAREDQEWLKTATPLEVLRERNRRLTELARVQAILRDESTYGFSVIGSDGKRVDPSTIYTGPPEAA